MNSIRLASRHLAFAAILTLSLLWFQPPAAAEGHGFKAGQKIQWKDRITGKWQEGEFVGETPGGKQPIILQRPGEAGTQTAYTWNAIKAGTDDDEADAPPSAPAKPWVAFKYRASNPGEEWLGLAEVNRRSVREGAMRIPEK